MFEYARVDNTKVGDHVTMLHYTDRESFTVIKKTKWTIVVQRDQQEIDHSKWKRVFHPGGFFGHTSNDQQQVWTVTPDPAGATKRFWADSSGVYHAEGAKRPNVICGAHPFHDHNF